MPVFNGEEYLVATIDSVLIQTFVNFELIIIDDGSTDQSLEILREYEKRDARIRLISRENRNLATTLNDIIDLAHGQWLARMDQDDIALPHRLERQLQWLSESGADVCGSWAQLFGTSDKRILKHPQSDEAIKSELLFGCPFAHPTVMMKTKMVKELRYDKKWESCEDYDLWERAARAGWRMTNVPEVLLKYRMHDSQVSTTSFFRQQELTQKIRRRYWTFIFDSMELEKGWIDEIIKLREPKQQKINMDIIDLVFSHILAKYHTEARSIVFDHMTRLYFRAAADCSNVAVRWERLHQECGEQFSLSTRLNLWLVSKMHIRPDSILFETLKRLSWVIRVR